ncbi:uncharacterized protein F54H12.2-like [Saccostrea echinata]|uniref:uncharacterized protein F54H12.2-like n=1 Tax=Saccostrea echinata TaxID=191078 RepID=UPI002A815D59|nr:uncharacterized protein F54H12.2-like [Saccostrea echinata]
MNLICLPYHQEKIYYQEIRPISQQSNNTSPIQFNISGQSGLEYLDLKRSQVYLKVRIRRENGQNLSPDDHVGPVNMLLHALFQQVDVNVQGKIITLSTGHYPYRAMFQIICGFGQAAKRSQLSAILWERDTPSAFDDADVNTGRNLGLYARSQYFKNGEIVELQGPIYHDVFQTDRYLLNQTSVTVKFFQSKPEFYLMTQKENADYVIEIEDMVLKICKIQLSPAILYTHAHILESANACHPYTRTEVKTLSVPTGQNKVTWDQIYQNARPNRILVALVKSQSVAGGYTLSPWNFLPFDISQINLSVDGIPVSGNTMELNYSSPTTHLDLPILTALYEVTGRWMRDCDLDINREDVAGGYCIFAFELEPTFQYMNCMSLIKQGNVRLDLQFAAGVPEPITVVLYSESMGYFELTKTRDIVL